MAAGSHRVVSRSGGGRSAATFFPTIMFFLLLCIASTVMADTCWGLDGRTMVNNRKCPGSNACCGEKATCLSNRLCHNQGDPPDLWVRGPCFINGWDENTDCAQICLYNETLTNRFPRVTQCEDGSLCCDDNKDCCAEGKGVFLDETGNRVSARATGVTLSWAPGFSITSTSTSSTPTSSAITTTSSGTSSPSSAQTAATTPITGSESSSTDSPAENAESSSSSDMVGLKVGLGLGIPLAVLVSGLLVYCFLKRRNAAASGQGEKDGYGYQSTIGGAPPSEMHGDASYISEAPPNYKPGYVYSGGGGGMTTVKTLNANSYPVELGNHMSTELDANNSVGAQPPQRYYEMA